MGRFFKWTVGVLIGLLVVILLFPATQSGGWGGHRRSPQLRSASNLRQIGLGLMGYSNRYDHLPPGATYAPDGTPLHGWPALILPYADNIEMYDAMNFARPWDDPVETAPPMPSNRAITRTNIGIYKNPGVLEVSDLQPLTSYFGYATNAWVIGGPKSMRLSQITDGASQTILAGEVAGEYRLWGAPVHWRDPGLGINKSPQGFGGPWDGGGANFLFVDGSVKFLRAETPMATFRALATPDSGEKVNLGELP